MKYIVRFWTTVVDGTLTIDSEHGPQRWAEALHTARRDGTLITVQRDKSTFILNPSQITSIEVKEKK
ncbi:hypothetical protein PBI_PEREGRIN_229 [Rhodococcus phage Peregrin]|nr:hypothetical protein PBI_PEREGRIN_229 [Rhodococcus phage Peregrin]